LIWWGFPPAPRGVPKIEVTFDIDANGIVHVSAKDLGTGKEQSIRITAPHKLSQEEIERMVKDAEKYAEEDKKRKELAEIRNQADNLIYTTEKSLKDYGDKVSAQEKKNIEGKLNALKDAKKTDDKEKIKAAIDELAKASHKLAEEVYKATAKNQAQGGAQGASTDTTNTSGGASASGGKEAAEEVKDAEVVDADFKEEGNK